MDLNYHKFVRVCSVWVNSSKLGMCCSGSGDT